MKTRFAAGLAFALTLAAGSASAGQLDKLGGMLGGGGGSSLTSGSMGNAAGIIQYCLNNNYLGGESGASGVKDQLISKLGGDSKQKQDMGFVEGQRGLLNDDKGKTILDLGKENKGGGNLKAQLTTKVCDAVLKQGKKWVGM